MGLVDDMTNRMRFFIIYGLTKYTYSCANSLIEHNLELPVKIGVHYFILIYEFIFMNGEKCYFSFELWLKMLFLEIMC